MNYIREWGETVGEAHGEGPWEMEMTRRSDGYRVVVRRGSEEALAKFEAEGRRRARESPYYEGHEDGTFDAPWVGDKPRIGDEKRRQMWLYRTRCVPTHYRVAWR